MAENFKCSGNCLNCMPAQRAYCASQHAYSNMKVLDTMMGVVIAIQDDLKEMREKIEAPLTEIGLDKLIDRAKRLIKGNIRIEKVLLETAIINNWKNVYPPRESELARLNNDMREELKDILVLFLLIKKGLVILL